MRSLIVAPADEKRLAEALESGADGIVVDLTLAAPDQRATARAVAVRFLKEARACDGGPALVVGLHALDSGEADLDLDAVMASAPAAILLPGSSGGARVQQLSAGSRSARPTSALAVGSTLIIAIADTARSLFRPWPESRLQRAADRPRLELGGPMRRHRHRAISRPLGRRRRALPPSARPDPFSRRHRRGRRGDRRGVRRRPRPGGFARRGARGGARRFFGQDGD